MASFLALCQQVAEESGTFPDATKPTTVTGQAGRLAKVVNFTARAWATIQARRRGWLWMRSTFSSPTVASQRAYTGAQMGVASRFGQFWITGDGREERFSLFDPDIGQVDEGSLRFVPYDRFAVLYEIGAAATEEGKPTLFTIGPDGQLRLHPIPDKVYTVRGPYQKSPQALAADADEPEMPAQFHDLIMYEALIRFLNHDEGSAQFQLWERERKRLNSALVADQLPRFGDAGVPLA